MVLLDIILLIFPYYIYIQVTFLNRFLIKVIRIYEKILNKIIMFFVIVKCTPEEKYIKDFIEN